MPALRVRNRHWEPWLPPPTQTSILVLGLCWKPSGAGARAWACEVLPCPLAAGSSDSPSAPSQAPNLQGLQTSPAEMSLFWTQTAKQGMLGRLSTSSSSRSKQRGRPPQARRMRMQRSPQKRRRSWTLWASCGRCPRPLPAGSRLSRDGSSIPSGSMRPLPLPTPWALTLCGLVHWGKWLAARPSPVSLGLSSAITCPYLLTGWPPTTTPRLCTEAWQSCPPNSSEAQAA